MTIITPDRMIATESRLDDPCGPSTRRWIGEAGGLTQFGAFVETLPPGSRSSIKHWHETEDEMAYVLEGELTVIEGDASTLLRAGDAATFKAGDPVGHCLANESDRPARYLMIGTRAACDRITYPDRDRVCTRTEGGDVWTDTSGRPAGNPYVE